MTGKEGKLGDETPAEPRRKLLVTLSFAAILFVGYLHYLSGTEIEFHPLFLLPIAAATWVGGASVGVTAALFGAAVWFVTDWWLTDGAAPGMLMFNELLRLGVFFIVVFFVARWKAALERESLLAQIDPLTGLSNRRAFFALGATELAHARRSRQSVAAVFFDVDGFKTVNDTLGHAAGDELLCTVAELLHSRCRATDLCARMGGDEFALLLFATGAGAAQEFADTLRQLLLEAMRRHDWSATFSIGVAVFKTPPDDVAQLVSHADALMYAVKQSGKDNIRIEVL